MTNEELLTALKLFSPTIVVKEKTNRAAIQISTTEFLALAKTLQEDSKFGFDMLCDHTAVDWVAKNQIELLYQLTSSQNNHSLTVSVLLDRTQPIAKSVSSIWAVAEWQEREVYDLFGVLYENHPDLRRLLLEDDWQGFPLRKDYKDSFMLERPW